MQGKIALSPPVTHTPHKKSRRIERQIIVYKYLASIKNHEVLLGKNVKLERGHNPQQEMEIVSVSTNILRG